MEYWKYTLRDFSKKTRGPKSVFESLQRGLHEINQSYVVNKIPSKNERDAVVHVLSGVQALKDAIALKKAGVIKTIVAGPNIVVTPADHNKLITNPLIDSILVPSQWIQDLYAMYDPALISKISIWPAGVAIPALTSEVQKTFDCLVYKKDVPRDLYEHAIAELKSRNIPYRVIQYGNYSPEAYYNLLLNCKYMIYLQNVESQGLSLQEAWARNIPTLVWNKETFTYPQGFTVTGNINAPYLSAQNGQYFKDKENFTPAFDSFIKNLINFKPRQDCISRLSDKASAEKYVSIINNIPHDH